MSFLISWMFQMDQKFSLTKIWTVKKFEWLCLMLIWWHYLCILHQKVRTFQRSCCLNWNLVLVLHTAVCIYWRSLAAPVCMANILRQDTNPKLPLMQPSVYESTDKHRKQCLCEWVNVACCIKRFEYSKVHLPFTGALETQSSSHHKLVLVKLAQILTLAHFPAFNTSNLRT